MSKRAAAIALILLVLALAGCSSQQLPPQLTEEQQRAIATTRFKATVGVETYKYPVYSERLLEDLRKTGIFERVDPLWSFDTPPTFVARVERGIYGKAGIPLWTIISLGLVPTIVEEEHGHAFSLTPSSIGTVSGKKHKIAVNFSYRGPSILGWWAMFQVWNSDQTVGNAKEHKRFVQSLAWHVVAREQEIAAHIGGGT